MTLINAARHSLAAALELALPTTCGGCGTSGAAWCPRCAAEMASAIFPGGAREVSPTPAPQGYPPTWAASPYSAAVRAAIVAFKDGERRDLVAVLAPLLADSMAASLAGDPYLRGVLTSGNGPVLVVPVPSSPAAIRRRGDSPLALLTRAGVRQVGLAHSELRFARALRLRRLVADQTGLDHGQRAENLDGAIEVRPRWLENIPGMTVLLVDDVQTTGATLMEAARALRACGARHVAGATIAANQRRGIPREGFRGPEYPPGPAVV